MSGVIGSETNMAVLGIETSCDDTAAAVIDANGLRSEVVWSQALHARYGGVVPELASRAHAEQIVAVVRAALAEAGITRPDAIAVTAGPGLMGALLVGLSYAKALSLGWGVPWVGVNHLEAHQLSGLMEPGDHTLPALSLVISGGHTTVYEVQSLGVSRIVCETVDDAVGEAYDKVARLLGLGYPGGPAVERLAGQGTGVRLPRPRVARVVGGVRASVDDMSFSGLKTAVRSLVDAGHQPPEDVCAGFQAAVVDVLVDRVVRASEATGLRTVMIGGGAAANAGIRAGLVATGLRVVMPPKSRCTDNAAMIAFVGRQRLLRGECWALTDTVRARWQLGE